MNIYLLKNKEIRASSIINIDGVDDVFEANAYSLYSRYIDELYDLTDIYVDEVDTDDEGEFIELRIPRPNQDNNLYLSLYRYILCLKNTQKPLSIS